MVRAKFVCESKVDTGEGCTQITLRAVYSGSEENKEFFRYTPSATVQLATVNPKASEQFEVGQEYYVDFSKAEPIVEAPPVAAKPLHPATADMLKFFAYEHLPPKLQAISKPIGELARSMAARLEGAELTAGLRKLLEAKDCLVRASL